MNINVIENYIKKIDINDMKDFLLKQEIIVNDLELNYLYKIMKTKYKDILDEDILLIYDIKKNINEDAYLKLISIFNKYKKLYKK